MTENKYKEQIDWLSNKANEQQEKASDPAHSAWVEASAGTGKTKVLSDRVLRLLLEGVAPSKILCLTYTKAAAAEMKTRINDKLSKWAVMSEKDLKEELNTLYYKKNILENKPDITSSARKLFAKVLDTMDQMRVETIHAFCTEILKRFPLEAGVSPYFEVAEEQETNEMLNHVSQKLLAVIEENSDVSIKEATLYLTSHIKELNWIKFLKTLVAKRHHFLKIFKDCPDIEAFKKSLRRKLKLNDAPSREGYIQDFAQNINQEAIKMCALCLLEGDRPSDRERGKQLIELLENFDFDAYFSWFLTNVKTGVYKSRNTLACVDVLKKHPEVDQILRLEALRLLNLYENLKSVSVYETTSAVATVALKLIDDYAAYKRERSCMDFDDLIMTTYALFEQKGASAWVLYKLDNGIDHILLDEAQDTSALAWKIINKITSEFFAGSGQKQEGRTFFVVGDRKQSIYSFQGADPKTFDDMREQYKEKLETVDLQVSFRSTEAVLDMVNKLFLLEDAGAGVCDNGQKVEHLPFRKGEGGLVEFWPLTEPDEKPENVWKEPIYLENSVSSVTKLAYLIARKIKDMVSNHELLASKGRPLQYGDFMVLVRDRKPFMEEFVHAAKELGVNITGVDRLHLKDEIAVEDLCALSRFLLLPEDDLSLACVLRSPLYGLSEEDLFELCYQRGEKTLWQRLKENKKFETAKSELAELLYQSTQLRPFELFDMVLNKFEGKKRFYERLGIEAKDALDEFMNLTLKFEASHVPNLQNFISWLAQNDVEVKRELEQATTDAVRLMTVHKSKGLQAPIVILPDTTRFVDEDREQAMLLGDETFYFPLAAEFYNDNCERAHNDRIQKEIEESHRLLYVAATRAEDRLYIAGLKGPNKESQKNWYQLFDGTLSEMPTVKQEGKVRLEVPQEVEPETKKHDELPDIQIPQNIAWLAAPQKEENVLKTYHPSHVEDLADDAVSSPLASDAQNFKRGLLIHKLLQMLPRFSSFEKMEAMIKAYLAKQTDLNKDLKDGVEKEVLNVLSNKDFAFIFEGDSRAEVPVMGVLDEKLISGQIDRLVVLQDKVLIVDFKTNRPAAATSADVSANYKQQLDIYAQLIGRVYPNLNVEKYILWTNTLKLMKI